MLCEAFAAPAGLTAALGYVDALICEGKYQIRPALPSVPGTEVSGHVVAIDVARWLGVRTIAAAATAEKRAAAIAQGAEASVDYSRPDWRSQLESDAEKAHVDIVFDTVGGAASEAAFRTLAPCGRHLVVGFASGEIPKLPLNLPLLKRSSIIGVDWGGAVRANRGLFRPGFGDIVAALASRALRLVAAAPVPLASASASLALLAARRWQGKLVVAISQETNR